MRGLGARDTTGLGSKDLRKNEFKLLVDAQTFFEPFILNHKGDLKLDKKIAEKSDFFILKILVGVR
jgi:hypothetical protein